MGRGHSPFVVAKDCPIHAHAQRSLRFTRSGLTFGFSNYQPERFRLHPQLRHSVKTNAQCVEQILNYIIYVFADTDQ